jgi:hypothetical protein
LLKRLWVSLRSESRVLFRFGRPFEGENRDPQNISQHSGATLLANSPSYVNTLQFQLAGSNSTALNNYLEMAWLITQLQAAIDANDVNTAAQDEWAIWSFTGGLDPYGTNSTLLSEAQLAVQNGFTVSNWEILTPDTGQVGQELIVMPTPETGTLIFLLAGVAALLALGRLHNS